VSLIDAFALSPTVRTISRRSDRLGACSVMAGPYAKRELLRLCARIGYTPH